MVCGQHHNIASFFWRLWDRTCSFHVMMCKPHFKMAFLSSGITMGRGRAKGGISPLKLSLPPVFFPCHHFCCNFLARLSFCPTFRPKIYFPPSFFMDIARWQRNFLTFPRNEYSGVVCPLKRLYDFKNTTQFHVNAKQ